MDKIEQAYISGFIKAANDNPYEDKGCPICGKHAVDSCRCIGPHSKADLANGHGLKCPNGHRFNRDGLVYDASKE